MPYFNCGPLKKLKNEWLGVGKNSLDQIQRKNIKKHNKKQTD